MLSLEYFVIMILHSLILELKLVCLENLRFVLMRKDVMEIRIYKDFDSFHKGKYFYCANISCPDVFNFSEAKNVFKSIYGTNIIISLICVIH